MGVIAQYQVSAAVPAVVSNPTLATLTYFASNPPLSLWNTGVTGVNSPQQSSQIGQTPTASNAGGQLQIYTASGTPAGVNFVLGGPGEGKLLGQRFRVYASGNASIASGATGTVNPIIQVNKGTIASPSYVTLGGGVASGAFVTTPTNVGWSIAFDGMLDPTSLTIFGFMKYQFAFASGSGSTNSSASEAAITAVTLTALANAQGQAGFGLVAGVTFTNVTGVANLYEFRVVED
jgi:hypothetical protein